MAYTDWAMREVQRVEAAEQLLKAAPEQYTKVLGMLMEGNSPSSINKVTGVSISTIKGIQSRHPDIAQGIREQVLGHLTEIQTKALRRLAEELGDIPIEKLALTYGIIADKTESLLNRAAEKTNSEKPLDSDSLIAELEKLKVRDVEVQQLPSTDEK